MDSGPKTVQPYQIYFTLEANCCSSPWADVDWHLGIGLCIHAANWWHANFGGHR